MILKKQEPYLQSSQDRQEEGTFAPYKISYFISEYFIAFDFVYQVFPYNYEELYFREPPLSESQWKKLLKDLLDLREKCYHSVYSDQCYEVK